TRSRHPDPQRIPHGLRARHRLGDICRELRRTRDPRNSGGTSGRIARDAILPFLAPVPEPPEDAGGERPQDQEDRDEAQSPSRKAHYTASWLKRRRPGRPTTATLL